MHVKKMICDVCQYYIMVREIHKAENYVMFIDIKPMIQFFKFKMFIWPSSSPINLLWISLIKLVLLKTGPVLSTWLNSELSSDYRWCTCLRFYYNMDKSIISFEIQALLSPVLEQAYVVGAFQKSVGTIFMYVKF